MNWLQGRAPGDAPRPCVIQTYARKSPPQPGTRHAFRALKPPTCHNQIVTDATTKPKLSDTSNDGDHDRFAHYVKKSDIVRANVQGVEVEALCGKRWIPSRDPSAYPVCPTCKELYAARGNR